MKFVVGIGNVGQQYESTRHNIGFMVIDALSGDSQTSWVHDAQELKNAYYLKHGESTIFIRPATFVNASGDCVVDMAEKYSSPPKDFLIICDDVNLTFGKLRLRESGSAGGHHGLESIIQGLGSEYFPRLRIGIGNDNMPDDLTSFVLGKFSASEKKDLDKIIEKAVSVCEAWINKGFESARDRLSQLQSVKEKGE